MSLLRGDRKWRFKPFKSESWSMYFDVPPSGFHRWMQSMFFGFQWIKEDTNDHPTD